MVVLLGYMGSGKSTAGRKLAVLSGMQFIDFDEFIEEKEQKSIPEIFAEKGEVYFRKKERTYLQELLGSNPQAVIALGGGTPCFGDNMQIILESNAKVIYLKATVQTLTQRLMTGKAHRPMISHLPDADLEEFIRKHLFERNFYYLQAPVKVDVDGLTTEELVDRLRSLT